jgi:hypothetical protein
MNQARDQRSEISGQEIRSCASGRLFGLRPFVVSIIQSDKSQKLKRGVGIGLNERSCQSMDAVFPKRLQCYLKQACELALNSSHILVNSQVVLRDRLPLF